MSGIYVRTPSQMPKQDHWVIIDYSSIYVPGDERSRTNPGHGYPGGSESVVLYIAYTDYDEWEAAVKKRTIDKGVFTAAFVKQATIQQEVFVKVVV